jgi:Spo0E like sporulation regulatory protein
MKLERIFTLSKEQLITLIEKKREELIQIASKNGLNSTIAIHYSQELDELLNEYNRVYIKKIAAH